tara:strand:- start:398 stop:736 length:339 start_codon:yes stop_codon:yes gene_type:complete
MATKLTKPIYREAEVNGVDYIVGLDPETGFTSRKKGSRGKGASTPLRMLIGVVDDKPKESRGGTREEVVNELKSKILGSGIDYKLKVEILDALIDILEVDRLAILEGATHDK